MGGNNEAKPLMICVAPVSHCDAYQPPELPSSLQVHIQQPFSLLEVGRHVLGSVMLKLGLQGSSLCKRRLCK